ncbi:MAG: hypothetical protein ACJASU_002384 [Cognaticolwellia sp.]|jgi:hypothetical protein
MLAKKWLDCAVNLADFFHMIIVFSLDIINIKKNERSIDKKVRGLLSLFFYLVVISSVTIILTNIEAKACIIW